MEKETILVSACLLGVQCRYDGKEQQIPEFQKALPELMKKYHLVPVCPELFGGLTTPRDPAEIRDGRVVTKNGADVTNSFVHGAEQTVKLAELYHCRYAILKKRSPSCGHGKIYDGTFSGTVIDGSGKTAGMLSDIGITVVSEDEIRKLMM